jgi:hypothetical protein
MEVAHRLQELEMRFPILHKNHARREPSPLSSHPPSVVAWSFFYHTTTSFVFSNPPVAYLPKIPCQDTESSTLDIVYLLRLQSKKGSPSSERTLSFCSKSSYRLHAIELWLTSVSGFDLLNSVPLLFTGARSPTCQLPLPLWLQTYKRSYIFLLWPP